MKLKALAVPIMLALSGQAHAADKDLGYMVLCAKAAVFAEVFAESVQASKSRNESAAVAVAALNKIYAEKVDEKELELLLPWASMTEKFPGIRPSTGGTFVALSCMALLKDANYVPLASPDVVASTKKMLDACEAQSGTQQAVGACVKKNFHTLPMEKM